MSWRYFSRLDKAREYSGAKDFEADLLFLVNDQRQSYISSSNWKWPADKFWFNIPTHWWNLNLNMDPIRMDIVVR